MNEWMNDLVNQHQEINKKKEAKKDWSEEKESAKLLPYIGIEWKNIPRNHCSAPIFYLKVTIQFPTTIVQNAGW